MNTDLPDPCVLMGIRNGKPCRATIVPPREVGDMFASAVGQVDSIAIFEVIRPRHPLADMILHRWYAARKGGWTEIAIPDLGDPTTPIFQDSQE